MEKNNIIEDILAVFMEIDNERKKVAMQAHRDRPPNQFLTKALKACQDATDRLESMLIRHGCRERLPAYLAAKRLYQSGWRMWGVSNERAFSAPLVLALGEETRVDAREYEYPNDAWSAIAEELKMDEPDIEDRKRIWSYLCGLTDENG